MESKTFRVIVGSTNPVKISCVRVGFQKLFPDREFVVTGVSARSGVSDQPMVTNFRFPWIIFSAGKSGNLHRSSKQSSGFDEIGFIKYVLPLIMTLFRGPRCRLLVWNRRRLWIVWLSRWTIWQYAMFCLDIYSFPSQHNRRKWFKENISGGKIKNGDFFSPEAGGRARVFRNGAGI